MGRVRVLPEPFPLVLGQLHLVCTLHGLPVAFALTGAKADERETLLGTLAADPGLAAARPGQVVIGGKNYYGRGFEAALAGAGLRLPRPARKTPQGLSCQIGLCRQGPPG
jgi:hypothetical protein